MNKNAINFGLSFVISILIIVTFIVIIDIKCGNSKELPVRYMTIRGSTFDMDISVIITDDTAYARKFVMENLDSTVTSEDFNARAVTFGTEDGRPPIIWLHTDADVSIINHELMHVTINVMNWAGVPLTTSTEEVYAYELQYLTKKFYKQVKPIQ